jgi:1-deoxy-D-xylulose-5-phosphate reductoisomerase
MAHPVPSGPVGVAVLGSTGSVGVQALDVIARLPDRFRVVALAARTLSPKLLEQAAAFQPDLVAVHALSANDAKPDAEVVAGTEGLIAAACQPGVEIVLAAMSGHDGIAPVLAAIRMGRTIALANKETIVCAGELVMAAARRHGAEIRPVDSEHSALWQALGSSPVSAIERLILTASGGPFRRLSATDLERVTAEQALAHPTWSMGGKITVDSATLMNKGLEVIEARWLFDMPFERIDVVVHPESIVHSLVEFRDGSQIAQLSQPDMRLPIQLALTWPDRLPSPISRLSLADIGALTFEPPDEGRFPLLRIAREVGAMGSTFPTAMSAADDVAVAAFLGGRIRYADIARVVARVVEAHQPPGPLSLEVVFAADDDARRMAHEAVAHVV